MTLVRLRDRRKTGDVGRRQDHAGPEGHGESRAFILCGMESLWKRDPSGDCGEDRLDQAWVREKHQAGVATVGWVGGGMLDWCGGGEDVGAAGFRCVLEAEPPELLWSKIQKRKN